MDWLAAIEATDGLEQNATGRLISYIRGDDKIQLSGFFTAAELTDLAAYLVKQPPPLATVLYLPDLRQQSLRR